MTFLLFTTLNCKGCRAFNDDAHALSRRHDVPIRVYDVDDPRHLMRNLAAMRKYTLKTMPTLVLEISGIEVFRIETKLTEINQKTIENLVTKNRETL